MNPSTTIKVSLIEDHSGYRDVVSRALRKSDRIQLISDFGTAEIALREYKSSNLEAKPGIVLLDLNLPGMSGLEALPLIKESSPEANVIIVTQSDKEADVLQAVALGSSGYILKSSTTTQIIESIIHVANGGCLLGPEVADFILNRIKQPASDFELPKPLSDRELEILVLLSRGLIKKEIATKLNICQDTVAFHVKHIYEKLNVGNAPAAVGKSFRLGILS